MAGGSKKLKLTMAAIGAFGAAMGSLAATRAKQEKARAEGRHIPFGPYEALFKRPLDAALAAGSIVVLSPLMAWTALRIRKELGSPVFFKQVRPGMIDPATGEERLFELLKFRSMTDARNLVTGELLSDEERLTDFGKRLRGSSVDELPELFNILKGDMAVVGPRPQLVRDMVFMSDAQRRRHEVRPGLSGLAQVSGRNALDWECKLTTDLDYIDDITFLGDAKIVCKTIKGVVFHKGSGAGTSAAEIDVTDDYGDYLLAKGVVNEEEYCAAQECAKAILKCYSEKTDARKVTGSCFEGGIKENGAYRKHLWILNHYASCPDYPNEHRHHDLAKKLVSMGYRVTIIAASTMHNMDVNLIADGTLTLRKEYDGVEYIFVRARDYKGNGKNRVLNMWDYHKGLSRACSQLDSPDVVMACSPHLLAAQDGIKVAREYGVPCVCEVRDLWPESFVSYGYLTSENPVARFLYSAERKMYERADAIVFTLEGGADYIVDKGWDSANGGKVDLAKIYYINNGIDLEAFNFNRDNYHYEDPVYNSPGSPWVVYAGSVRHANHLEYLVDVADIMRDDEVRFAVFGDGDELDTLRNETRNRKLTNIHFFGRVDKRYIPSILSRATIATAIGNPSAQEHLTRYGNSNNKMFDYFAAGVPVLVTFAPGRPFVNKLGCGYEGNLRTPQEYSDKLREMLTSSDIDEWRSKSFAAAQEFSFENLAKKLSVIIENVTEGRE